MMPGNVCKNFRDVIVGPCQCVPICKTHVLRLQINFPNMLCPACNRQMNGAFKVIKGGWEG